MTFPVGEKSEIEPPWAERNENENEDGEQQQNARIGYR